MIRITIDVNLVSLCSKLFNFLIVILILFLIYQNNDTYKVLTVLRDFCFMYKLLINHAY